MILVQFSLFDLTNDPAVKIPYERHASSLWMRDDQICSFTIGTVPNLKVRAVPIAGFRITSFKNAPAY